MLTVMTDFRFNDYPTLTDGEIEVVVRQKLAEDDEEGLIPSYECDVRLPDGSEPAGSVSLRIGTTPHILRYLGHIGYSIRKAYRGHHYAAKACRLVRRIAVDHGLKTLWITCNPENYPSRRTCELLGCEFVEIVNIPENTALYYNGERRKCRYRWDL